jgi:hypothetical protein
MLMKNKTEVAEKNFRARELITLKTCFGGEF